ncbi:3' exoribonuclease family, domain 1-domain-containing protein [Daldinia caldariorum]|uniref:3' exoribonuclease family, domain 1-domain-containing protein n=1 Tax=Daldinia caldariorum TaxID=326644 RepID=UPI002008E162|nr:3' exoribonuclease family, domain 1-domain-containing protein [Daldinia caldariorum]KAI1466662.1 3' exoribonuclease family, domain 1-domain-containing protein [Daldinia caldariorum]
MADRRRINGPVGQTIPPIYDAPREKIIAKRPGDNVVRKIFLKTGVTPSASGSAYLEIEDPFATRPSGTSLKLTCTVHGPRALPRSAPFSPHIILSTHVKYAPFATRQRRSYLRDSSERDLGVHLETALRGAIIADRWPKSGVDIIVTIIEGDQNRDSPDYDRDEGWDMMNVLSGCITVASAAIADAGIDCVDTVAGGVAALAAQDEKSQPSIVLDPDVASYHKIFAACCVAYLPTRDEVTNVWFKGQLPGADAMLYNKLVERSLVACRNANRVLIQALNETVKPGQDVS